MIRFPLIAVLTLALATPAAAQSGRADLEKQGWRFLSRNGDDVLYMKADGAPKNGIRQVWTAYDLGVAHDRQDFSFRSVESLGEYNCAEQTSRVVREVFHARPGLKGKTWIMPNFIPTEWSVATGSVGDMKIAFACKL